MKLALLLVATVAGGCALINFASGFTTAGGLCVAMLGAAWLWLGYIRFCEESERLDQIIADFQERRDP